MNISVKAANADVTRWVRFNAWMILLELQHCNAYWIAPSIAPFLERPRPQPDTIDSNLSLVEEVATVLWLMHGEHELLLDRVRELSGPRETMLLPACVVSAFAGAVGPGASLDIVLQSLTARVDLLEAHAGYVDSHTRIVFKRHLAIVKGLILPTLVRVAELAGRNNCGLPGHPVVIGHEENSMDKTQELIRLYEECLPAGTRAHPDSFLKSVLLRSEQNRGHG